VGSIGWGGRDRVFLSRKERKNWVRRAFSDCVGGVCDLHEMFVFFLVLSCH
jgi:hypothetical protein